MDYENHQPLVSIIMNCYNGEKYLQDAIDSVYAQTYHNWEIIFWDNASTDNSANIAKSYDSKLKYYCGEKTITLGAARNKALEQVIGDYIAFLDCDDLWLSEKLEKQIPLFDNEKVGIVICNTLFFNEKGTNNQLYKKKKPPTGMVFKELLTEYFVSLETAIVRRQAVDDLKYRFDTRFEVIEEYDLFVRMGFLWELDYVDKILAKWRVHNSSWTWSKSELFTKETKLMLESLHENIPNFLVDYPEEIKFVERTIAFEKARILWKRGKKKQARKIMKPNIERIVKYQLLYFIMFFPYSFYKLLQKLRRNVYPV